MARILIVDDDSQARVLLNAVLGQQLGHDLVFAPDGEAAIESYRKVQPDLVITDLVMPQLNGILLIEHLKVMYPAVRIIAVSGKAGEQLERAEMAGAVAALHKPIRRDELLAAIERALSDPDPWRGEGR